MTNPYIAFILWAIGALLSLSLVSFTIIKVTKIFRESKINAPTEAKFGNMEAVMGGVIGDVARHDQAITTLQSDSKVYAALPPALKIMREFISATEQKDSDIVTMKLSSQKMALSIEAIGDAIESMKTQVEEVKVGQKENRAATQRLLDNSGLNFP